MFLTAKGFCVGSLFKRGRLSVQKLVRFSSDNALGFHDYDVRRALRELVAVKYVEATRSTRSPKLLYKLTVKGRNAFRRGKKSMRAVYGSIDVKAASADKKPVSAKATTAPKVSAEAICDDCGNLGHTSATCTFGR
jgi:predicted ArsR family transcriptional regulator